MIWVPAMSSQTTQQFVERMLANKHNADHAQYIADELARAEKQATLLRPRRANRWAWPALCLALAVLLWVQA